MIYKNEKEFKNTIADILKSADLYFSSEVLISGGKMDEFSYDPKRN